MCPQAWSDFKTLKTDCVLVKGQRQRHITLVERLKSHTATSEALVMSQAKLTGWPMTS